MTGQLVHIAHRIGIRVDPGCADQERDVQDFLVGGVPFFDHAAVRCAVFAVVGQEYHQCVLGQAGFVQGAQHALDLGEEVAGVLRAGAGAGRAEGFGGSRGRRGCGGRGLALGEQVGPGGLARGPGEVGRAGVGVGEVGVDGAEGDVVELVQAILGRRRRQGRVGPRADEAHVRAEGSGDGAGQDEDNVSAQRT